MLLGALYGALMPGEETKPSPPVYGPEATLLNVSSNGGETRVEPRAAVPSITVDAMTGAWGARAGLLKVTF
jgi:hypothetical protein